MTEAQYDKLSNGKLIKGDVVVCVRGSLGKHGRYPFDKGAIASSLVILRCHLSEEILAEYIMLWLDSPVFFSEIKKYDNGTAQPNLAAKSLEQFIVPFPPLSEQQRIINKINEIMPIAAKYDTTHSKVKELNETFPEVLKRSILQWAVQGRLVPQNPTDEPASVLLERIRTEKQKLIKEGKIKKDKHESVIFRRDNSYYEKLDGIERCIDDEIPFEIPDSWEWVRLKELCFIINGFTPLRTNVEYWENPTIHWFTVDDIRRQGRRITSTIQSINEKALAKNTNRILPPGTVLLCCTASVGEFAITEIPLTTNQQFNGLVIKNYWKNYFWNEFLFTIAETFKDRLLLLAGKTTINFISVKKLENLVIPLPPINEQHRIVKKLKEISSYIE